MLLTHTVLTQSSLSSGSPTSLQNCNTDLLFPSYLGQSDENSLKPFDSYWKSTGAPKCAYDFGEIGCEALNSSLVQCKTADNPQGCFCLAVAETPCPSLCRQKSDPPHYVRWILEHYCFGPHLATTETCKDSTIQPKTHPDAFQPPLNITRDEFKTLWKDYGSLQLASHNSLFAWNWQVVYDPTEKANATAPYKCPTKTAQLGSFALVNVITVVASVILGHRKVVKYLTCKLFGNTEDSTSWWALSGALSAGLSIGANAINAILIKHTFGFGHVSVVSLVLLWCARPRLAWLGALLAMVGEDENYYTSLGASCSIAEGILQGIASFYIGRTAHWGVMLGYLQKGHMEGIPGAHDAAMMYAGALLWLVTVGLMFIVWIIFTAYSMLESDKEADDSSAFGIAFSISMVLPLIGQWLFWAGFIGLAGDR